MRSEALEDAEAVLQEDPGHAKARYRRMGSIRDSNWCFLDLSPLSLGKLSCQTDPISRCAKALFELGRRQEAAAVLQQLDDSNEEMQRCARRFVNQNVQNGASQPFGLEILGLDIVLISRSSFKTYQL